MSKLPLTPPARIKKSHVTAEFESGEEELDTWLRDYALINDRSGNSRVFVAARGDLVVGYYALALTGVEKAVVPEELKKGSVPHQVPCLLLARLAVDRTEGNRGIGKGLVVDVIRRAVRISEDAGVRAILIHAQNDDARQFYEHLGEFVQSPTDPLHLFIHLKHATKLMPQ